MSNKFAEDQTREAIIKQRHLMGKSLSISSTTCQATLGTAAAVGTPEPSSAKTYGNAAGLVHT